MNKENKNRLLKSQRFKKVKKKLKKNKKKK